MALLAMVLAGGPVAAQQVRPIIPRAYDGRSLEAESLAIQATYSAVWGAQDAARWIDDHNADLARSWTGPVPRIGLYSRGSIVGEANTDYFVEGLRELGYVPGQSIILEYRFADGQTELLTRIMSELVRLPVDVIVGIAGVQSAMDATQATSTIPVVLIAGGDPVGTGLLANAQRPEGNATGFDLAAPDTWARRLELVKEAMPDATRVGFLWNPDNPTNISALRQAQTAALAVDVQLQSIEVRSPSDVDAAFAAAVREGADVLLPTPAVSSAAFIGPLVQLSRQYRLPVIGPSEGSVDAGLLMAHAPDSTELPKRAAGYVDRILKGAVVADLPLGYPSQFNVLINVQAAEAIGFTFPKSIIDRASRVIQ